MKIVSKVEYSGMGSVKLLPYGDGFYDVNNNIVFVPLSPQEQNNFMEAVNNEEIRCNRKLTSEELEDIGKTFI